MKEKVLVMMSGGVDSSVSAAVLVHQGVAVTGITLLMTPPGDTTPRSVEDARKIASLLGIPHRVHDLTIPFENEVLQHFRESYHLGRTPNPCYRCNDRIKFGLMADYARTNGFDYMATGHYCRIGNRDGQFYIQRGADPKKDQSYFLAAINPRVLPMILFPVGGMVKEDVRNLARQFQLPVAEKSESQETCFSGGGDYRPTLDDSLPGEMVDTSNHVVGQHTGITHYTIGQRKGIGLSGGPFFVTAIQPEQNRVVVGQEQDLYASEIEVDSFNHFAEVVVGKPYQAMPRYRHTGSMARVIELSGQKAVVRFETPERSLTPGQALVLYEEDRVLAGSVIQKVR
jgi:tRNA-specific 2-thiouridylase